MMTDFGKSVERQGLYSNFENASKLLVEQGPGKFKDVNELESFIKEHAETIIQIIKSNEPSESYSVQNELFRRIR